MTDGPVRKFGWRKEDIKVIHRPTKEEQERLKQEEERRARRRETP